MAVGKWVVEDKVMLLLPQETKRYEFLPENLVYMNEGRGKQEKLQDMLCIN